MANSEQYAMSWRINIPALTAIAAVGITVLGTYSSFVSKQERQDARLDAMDKDRSSNMVAYQKSQDNLATSLSMLIAQGNKSEYRITVAEQGILANSQRMDRFADAMGDLRDGIAKVNTSIELLTQELKQRTPPSGG